MTGKIKIAVGIALVALSAILSPPLMTRFWDERQLTLASIAILAHGLMGTIDFFRPIVVRRVAENAEFATINNLLLPSACSSLLIALALSIAGTLYFPKPYLYILLSVSASIVIYGIYSPLWGLLNASLRMADTYLIRSFSITLLYGSLGIGSLLGRDEIIYASLIGANIVPGIIFYQLSKGRFAKNRWSIDRKYWLEVCNVVAQNSARSVNDFGDRLASTFFLPLSAGGKYILLSDLASRSNFISQLVATQTYPVLCHDKGKSKPFLLVGLCISSSITLSSMIFMIFGKGIYIWYLGSGMEDFFWIFCCLLSSFGVHTLSYFGQVILRSRAMDRSLSLSLLAPAFICLIYLLAFWNSFTIYNVVVVMLISKTSAIFMMLRLLQVHKLYASLGILCCLAGLTLSVYILEYVISGGAHGAWLAF